MSVTSGDTDRRRGPVGPLKLSLSRDVNSDNEDAVIVNPNWSRHRSEPVKHTAAGEPSTLSPAGRDIAISPTHEGSNHNSVMLPDRQENLSVSIDDTPPDLLQSDLLRYNSSEYFYGPRSYEDDRSVSDDYR